ncbi:hypothetical protein [Gemmiger formicilis]|uniref:hypothetical protein n=1 Tax=Gemmiger formicilis TaxID=745368 RepID=UPI003D31D6BD
MADLPRENYCEAEQRIVEELDAIGKPYIILLNCAEPGIRTTGFATVDPMFLRSWQRN